VTISLTLDANGTENWKYSIILFLEITDLWNYTVILELGKY
jgi:hypothetical protein